MNFAKTRIFANTSDKKILFFAFSFSLLLHAVLLSKVGGFFDLSFLKNQDILETKIIELTKEEINKIKERPSLLPEIQVVGEFSRFQPNHRQQTADNKPKDTALNAEILEQAQSMQMDKKAEAVMLKYQDALKQRIEAKRKYPFRARQKQIQGIVGICFNVLRNGVSENIEVTNSSGSELLDQEALDTIKRVDHFPPFPDEITAGNVKIHVAIVFSLE